MAVLGGSAGSEDADGSSIPACNTRRGVCDFLSGAYALEVIASLQVRDQVVQLSLIPDIAICKINSNPQAIDTAETPRPNFESDNTCIHDCHVMYMLSVLRFIKQSLRPQFRLGGGNACAGNISEGCKQA